MNKFPTEIFKTSKIAIDGVVQGFSHRLSSHRSSWAYMLASQLRYEGYEYENVVVSPTQDINDFDIWIIDHGMEFQGGFNIFGGANDALYERLKRFLDFKGTCYSMHIEMPNIGDLIRSRYKTGSDLFKTLVAEDFDKKCAEIQCVEKILESTHFIFGDSHSLSMYKPGAEISRNDGLTLFGALKRGLKSYIPKHYDKLTCYLGNIDIRHHLCRQSNPKEAVLNLAREYGSQLLEIKNGGTEIEIISALPIENESRVLPKTGWYKGTPFIGSWKERTELSNLFNQAMALMAIKLGFELYCHPPLYTNDKGELDFAVMEKPKSVHLSREFYRYDFDELIPNPKLTLMNYDLHETKLLETTKVEAIPAPKTTALF